MKKILILLTIVVGLTSCPAKHHDDWVIFVKFTQEDYSQYVMGIRDADSVKTFKRDFYSADEPVGLIYLSDGWWFIDAVTDADIVNYSALGEMSWEEFNNRPEEENDPAVSALKDSHPYADITQIALDKIVTPDNYDTFSQINSSAFISNLREIIETGKLDEYRNDWIAKRMGMR